MSTLRVCNTNVPQSLIRKMVLAGAEKKEAEGEDLCVLYINCLSLQAWNLFKNWAADLGEVDPLVQGVFAPSPAILGTVLMPSLALVGPLMQEVNSLVIHYAGFHINAFVGGLPAIPGPIGAPQIPVHVHHAKVAVTALIDIIQHPPGANYPTIATLGAGSYICDIQYWWRGVVITVGVFKPA